MEKYTTENKMVTKYVHDDGSETSIKHPVADDCGGLYGKVRNKFNVFISCSVGCPIGCKFCYLTVKKFPYHSLSKETVVSNVIDAITDQINTFPHFKDFYVKLSWMGMGDAVLHFFDTIDMTDMIIRRVMEKKLCKGVDGIDIGTTMPSKAGYDPIFNSLDLFKGMLSDFPRNPLRTKISPIRIFYSMHSGLDETRKNLIPASHTLIDAFNILSKIPPELGSVIIHHMLLDGINDSDRDIDQVFKWLRFYKMPLRILRYNACKNSPFVESKNFLSQVSVLNDKLNGVKVQASPGSEVKAACGQFLLGQMENIKK